MGREVVVGLGQPTHLQSPPALVISYTSVSSPRAYVRYILRVFLFAAVSDLVLQPSAEDSSKQVSMDFHEMVTSEARLISTQDASL